jgi:hypothetical protein
MGLFHALFPLERVAHCTDDLGIRVELQQLWEKVTSGSVGDGRVASQAGFEDSQDSATVAVKPCVEDAHP